MTIENIIFEDENIAVIINLANNRTVRGYKILDKKLVEDEGNPMFFYKNRDYDNFLKELEYKSNKDTKDKIISEIKKYEQRNKDLNKKLN